MKQVIKIEHVTKRKSPLIIFNQHNIVNAILKAITGAGYRTYSILDISNKLSISTSDLTSILAHARIEVIDNCLDERGIQYLVDREVGKIKRYFEQSLANFTSLSEKEQRTFNAFLKRYGLKYRKIKKWNDLKIEIIRKDCYADLTESHAQNFFDGKFICDEEVEAAETTKTTSIIQLIRSSLMYNIKSMRKWIIFKPISDTTVVYILTHHFHIFTSDDSNSIQAAEQTPKFNLPQSANNYILVA